MLKKWLKGLLKGNKTKEKKKLKFIMMIGLSGAGKTTLAKEIKRKYNYELLSSDALRKELLHDENDQTQNAFIFEEMKKRTIKYLKEGKSVIYDATNLTVKSRRTILNSIKRYDCERIAYVVRTPFRICLENNRERKRCIPTEVIYKQRNKFQIPFKEEGFDEIIIEALERDINKYEVLNPVFSAAEIMVGVDQNSSHHKHSLFIHSMKTFEEVVKRGVFIPKSLKVASVLHDIGKLQTKSPKENHESESCYYNHDNVGAYTLLESCEILGLTYDEILDCLFYVNYHMLPFQIKEEKTKEKYLKMWGEIKFNNIMLLHQADLEACE